MSAGLTVAKSDVDTTAGSIARDLNVVCARIVNFKMWLDAQLDSDLTALGYTTADVANLRSAYVDAKQLADLYAGAAVVATAKDFRTFLKRLFGLGF